MQQFQSLFAHVGPDSFLSKLAQGDQSQFAANEAPALRQFNQLQGQIASRFSGMGRGARNSSGFYNTANQAASEFAENLQANRMQQRMQALQELMNFSSQLLNQKPQENFLYEKPKSFWQNFGETAGTSFAQGLGSAGANFVSGKFLGV